jgi:hypothetical protein
MHVYKIQLTRELKPTDHVQRREFVKWVLENQIMDGNFSKKITFSDDPHFQLDGCLNNTKLSDLGRGESSSDS